MSTKDAPFNELNYLIHHLFLPLQLPQEEDSSFQADRALCTRVIREAISFRGALVSPDEGQRWDVVIRMLQQLERTQQSMDGLSELIGNMRIRDSIVIPIAAQNAAVILRKQREHTIVECFEVDPPNSEIMAAIGRVVCLYPHAAIGVSNKTFDNPAFREELASFLSHMAVETLPDSEAFTRKAGTEVSEFRDSASGHYIVHLLPAILRGYAGSFAADVYRTRKRVRNEILWKDARAPWRRNPLWLVIRVAIQSTLEQDSVSPDTLYKSFMVYLMTQILRTAAESALSSELLFCMRAKIARRVEKLPIISPKLYDIATAASGRATALLEERWNTIRLEQRKSSNWVPAEFDLERDTHLSLPNSKDYIRQRIAQDGVRKVVDRFQPMESPRVCQTNEFRTLTSAILQNAFSRDKDVFVALADFEASVQNNIEIWVSGHQGESDCAVIATCIKEYNAAARLRYAGDPENQSMRLLVIFDLWVALDQLALFHHPQLRDYSPEVPLEILESLLIRKSLPLERVVYIQRYLRARHHGAIYGSVFTDSTGPKTFAARYFAISAELRGLYRKILDDAQNDRNAKITELQAAQREYSSLLEQAKACGCDYWENRWGYQSHSNFCKKCRLETTARGMDIIVHEWPLPSNVDDAKNVVFELCLPTAFRIWRDMTAMILGDICAVNPPSTAEIATRLDGYAGLRAFLRSSELPRITYASFTKSFVVSHYRSQAVAVATTDSICKPNGLRYRLYDCLRSCWAAASFSQCSLSNVCTPELSPSSPYSPSAHSLASTLHTPNSVLASQDRAHASLTLHEHISFESLRSGGRLQWPNITRELRMRILAFHHPDVHTLIAQAASQIGPISQQDVAEWHIELTEHAFGRLLLDELERLLSDTRDNWSNTTTVQTIVFLLGRWLVSACDHRDLVVHGCRLLREARKVTYDWMRLLISRLQGVTDQEMVTDFQNRICTVAAICRATYDVDPIYFDSILSSDEDTSIIIECSIVIHDNSSPRDTDIRGPLRKLLMRDRRLSHSIEPFLKSRVEQHRRGLDKAIQREWPGYSPDGPWVFASGANECWVSTRTASVAGADPQVVDVNIRNGTLLVDGKPLGRLPADIVSHVTYTRLFGKKVLDIIPSRLPGMDFATRQAIFGAQIHFHLDQTNELVIQAQYDSSVYELIPHHKFFDDLPRFFVDHYTHWLLLGQSTSSTVEFRPWSTWWETSTEHWQIEYCSWQMHLGTLYMMDVHSPTFKMCWDRVAALEEICYLTITVDRKPGGLLKVVLPRYKLSFFVNENKDLESLDLRGMLIDVNQSAGTLFGLSRQLVLRAEDSTSATQSSHPSRRILIVPFGKLDPRISGHHVKVDVLLAGEEIRYFKYDINTDLGFLKATTLTAGFFKILLHAYTSHPLIDPLTGRTGTEEALSELASSRSFSFQSLCDEDIALLKIIAALSPKRHFYPKHLKVMETVTWGAVWPLAQHQAFHLLVKKILQFAEDLGVFHPTTSLTASVSLALEERSEQLHYRSASELSKLYPVEFAHFLQSLLHDREYYPPVDVRLRSDTTESRVTAATHAADTAALVQTWPSYLNTVPDLRRQVEAWHGVSGDADLPLALSYNKSFTQTGFLPSIWCSLYTQCVNERTSISSSKLSFTLATIAYQLPEYRPILPTLLSFASVGSAFREHPCPSYPDHVYDFTLGRSPLQDDLIDFVSASAVPFEETVFANLSKKWGETPHQFQSRCIGEYNIERDEQIELVVQNLLKQWPCEKPSISLDQPKSLQVLRADGFRENVLQRFRHCFRNRKFHKHLGHVESLVLQHQSLSKSPMMEPYQLHSPAYHPTPAFRAATLHQVIQREPVAPGSSTPTIPMLELQPEEVFVNATLSTAELERILCNLSVEENTQSFNAKLYRLYIDAIERSRKKFDSQKVAPSFEPPAMDALVRYHTECRNAVKEIMGSILSVLEPKTIIAQESGQTPRINVRALLSELLSFATLPPRWQEKLVALAQSLIRLQRSQRLLRFSIMKMEGDLSRELANYTFEEDEAFQKPEWLLIQIDSNFIVRPIQSAVANEMMTPSSKQNSILQLNMGEGKSSVIVPLITALLADGKTLARVVVLKSLSVQMFQMLRNTLSGLVNRRIFFFPFSRDVQVCQASHAQKIQSLFELCMRERGVWIAQPEHILSFKLMGLDLMLDTVAEAGESVYSTLLRSQRWLNDNVRDVLDESDEILNVGYQLVYTSGRQAPLEDHPDRWTTIQGILAYVQEIAQELAEAFPTGVDLHHSNTEATFHSSIRILTKEAGDSLVRRIGRKLLETNEFRLLQPEIREDVFCFITESTPTISLVELRETCEHTALWTRILLCRGILAGGILVWALQKKRWRVEYGLDPRRTMLAVPYRAKDVPSLRTDFGHPDVAIVLTCLSYYYEGLTDKQVDLSFELLLALDNPALEYESWVRNVPKIPDSLREVIGINMEDMDQRRYILTPLFRRNLGVVNFYLRQVVFPKEAKQFPYKLATSAWDLAERKTHFVTGFSGTNDGQYLLPTFIAQQDPLDQLSTTAKVLSYLLRPESREYYCTEGRSTKDFMEQLLITKKPEIRVLLDVGAQMLDMQNLELAKHWLSIVPTLKAVVYFNDSDQLMVMARDGSTELLISSSFADQLEDCAVYLDDVHTRGTDLKLPLKTRAAITLGPGVTKDRLVQGCMRMRQLGQGQSVMFFAPPEVDRNIRFRCKLDNDSHISSQNIIQWVMLETIASIEHFVPHWAKQGLSYKMRHAAWSRYIQDDSATSVEGLRSTWVEKEARTLKEMYDFGLSSTQRHRVFDIQDMANRLDQIGFSQIVESSNDEEQEREVAHEVERERQVERPSPATPLSHELHPDVRQLVKTGVVKRDSPAFVSPFSMFTALDKSGAWSSRLLATRDFTKTIKAVGHPKDYIRPVTWILSTSAGGGHLIIISPWEANELLPDIRDSLHVHLHQYAPRTMENMRSFEDLSFYTLPTSRPLPGRRWGVDEITHLNLFAGQLYLKNIDEHRRLCNMLGLYIDNEVSGDGSPVRYESDGFVAPGNRRGAMAKSCFFTECPLLAVKDLVGLRRKGLDYKPTHMGQILHAGLLREEDFR